MNEMLQLVDDLLYKLVQHNKTKSMAIEELLETYSVSLKEHDSSANNNKVEQLHSDEELMSKIKSITFEIKECESRDIYWESWFEEEIAKLFKTYRNSNCKDNIKKEN